MTTFVPYNTLSMIVLFILIITIIYFSILNSIIIFKNSWEEVKCSPLNMLYTYINPELNDDGVFASCIEDKNISINKDIKNEFSNMLGDIRLTLNDIKEETNEFKRLYEDKYDNYIQDLSNNITYITNSNDKMQKKTSKINQNLNNTLNKINSYIDS